MSRNSSIMEGEPIRRREIGYYGSITAILRIKFPSLLSQAKASRMVRLC
jgi:hypothetical protein